MSCAYAARYKGQFVYYHVYYLLIETVVVGMRDTQLRVSNAASDIFKVNALSVATNYIVPSLVLLG